MSEIKIGDRVQHKNSSDVVGRVVEFRNAECVIDLETPIVWNGMEFKRYQLLKVLVEKLEAR